MLTKTREAIIAFSQSEKIKSGLIWMTHILESQANLSGPERRGAEATIQNLVSMIGHEAHIASKMVNHASWSEVQKHLDLALVMIRSGVPQEAIFHFTRAVSHVTNIGQRAMDLLKSQGLMA